MYVTISFAQIERALADSGEVAVVVASRVSADYNRVKLSNGTFEAETFVFGRGGAFNAQVDHSVDNLDFIDLAKILSVPLARERYLSSKDPNKTKLLIMVYWGMLTGSLDDPASKRPDEPPDGAVLDKLNAGNAPVIGYESVLAEADRRRLTALKFRSTQVVDEVEHNRYFVVLMAYDFQLMLKKKQRKLLWETRFSIPERDMLSMNNFLRWLRVLPTTSERTARGWFINHFPKDASI